MLNKLFKLKENNTNVKTEVIAGLTTFMAMAYILAVNPNILSGTGMNRDAVLLATAIASFIGCMAMALLANYPLHLHRVWDLMHIWQEQFVQIWDIHGK